MSKNDATKLNGSANKGLPARNGSRYFAQAYYAVIISRYYAKNETPVNSSV